MTEQPTRPIRKKKPSIRVELDLPIPPSVNQLWRQGKGGKVYNSPEYKAWIKAAGWTLVAQKPIGVPGPVKVVIKAGLPDQLRDLDNIQKALFDLLQQHEVVGNDRDIVDIACRWDRTVESGRVNVALWSTTHPAKRLSAEGRRRAVAGVKAALAALKERAAA